MAGWNGSERRLELPSNWAELVRETKRLAHGKCQWPGCRAWGAECDHIGDKLDHRQSNLRWLCRVHHGKHTAEQARNAKQAKKDRRLNHFYEETR